MAAAGLVPKRRSSREANAVLAAMQCGPQVRLARVVMVTSPELWPWVRPALDDRTLVYDCMDDALAFAQDDGVRALKTSWERELIARSQLVVCSSEELAARAAARGAAATHTTVVPNGWDDEAFPVQPSTPLPRDGMLELAYFGTIAAWLDVDALHALAALHPGISVRLIGPGDEGALAAVNGLRVEPPVAHHKLAQAVASAHALLLPFRVDELTRGVDPVKLYEYIALGKPIASAHWPGLDRFAGFVTFYEGVDALVSLFRDRSIAAAPGRERRAAFLSPQSWHARARALHDAIAQLPLPRGPGERVGVGGRAGISRQVQLTASRSRTTPRCGCRARRRAHRCTKRRSRSRRALVEDVP